LILNGLDIFGLKDKFGEGFAFASYVLIGFGLWYLLYWCFIKLILIPNIKITGKRDTENASKGGLIGLSDYALLEIETPPYFDITDCYMKIVKIQFIMDELGRSSEAYTDWVEINKVIDKKYLRKNLLCRNKDAKYGYIINVAGAEKEYFYVAQINFGTRVETFIVNPGNTDKEIKTKQATRNIRNFEFTTRDSRESFKYERMGLYEISIALYWKLDKMDMRELIYNGYIYSTMIPTDDGGTDNILFIRSGDWRQDKDIPALIETRKKNETEKPKQQEKPKSKATKRHKKRSPK
jgi:hypothetical protein